MADDLGAVWRTALDANARYYEAWGRLANDYVRELGDAVKAWAPTLKVPTFTMPMSGASTSTHRSTPAGAVPPTSPSSQQTTAPSTSPSLVLEADGGATATGAVLVQNHLTHPVSAVVAARFDRGAEPVDGELDVDVQPQRVDLAPGESTVVRVSVVVPETGPDDVRGEIMVPELVGTAVPLVIRRRSFDRASPNEG